MTQTTTIKAYEPARTIQILEGQSLTITGSAGAIGVAYLLDAMLGGMNTLKSWNIGSGSLSSVIGPFANSQLVHITCQAGQISATTQDAVLTVSGAVAAVITGSGAVNEYITATLPAGVVGTLQFTKTLKASPFTKSNISGAVANAVNSLQYKVLLADLPYNFGCDSSNTVSPSNTIAAVAASTGGDPTPAPATAITLTGPTPATATVGAESAAFTVALSPVGGTVASPVTVTPTAVAGVTFSPASVTLSTASQSATFTANSSTTGTKSIVVTSTGGLTAPAAINLAVSAGSAAPAVTSAAAITGAPKQGVALAITSAAFSGNPTPTVTRAIKIDGTTVASGDQTTGYTPVLADVGKIPSVSDTASNGVGSAVTSTGAGSAVTAASSTVNMILWMGQSQSNSNGNTTGGGGATTLAPVTPGLVPNVYIWDTLAKDWIGYNPGVTSSAHLRAGKYSETSNNYWGGEHQLALRWVADNPGVPLYILKKGHSTTSLQQAARSADRGCWDQNLRGDLYDELVTWASEAKAKLTSAGKTVNIQSAHWTQGENDGNITAQVATDYGPALTSFIASLRSAGVITNTTPFIVSRIKTGAWAFANELRAQQQLVAETAPYCRWVDADSVQIDGNDSVHYGPNGVVTHGNLMYDESLDGAGIAREYASRMTTAPTAPRLAALATLFDSLIAARVWSGISSMNLLAAETAQAALVNVRRAGVTPINSGMTFTANQGLTGTGTASFLNTKVNPKTDTKIARGNAAYAFYIRGNSSTTGVDMGYNVTDGSGAATIVGAAQSPGTSGFRINNSNTGASNQPAGVTDVSGLWSASRTALASCTLTQNGVQIGATDTTLTDLAESSTDIFLGNRNSGNNTSGTNGTLRQYSAFVAGTGRTLAQEVALSNAISAYMTAIGA